MAGRTGLQVDLRGAPVDEIDHVDVWWPAPVLRERTLDRHARGSTPSPGVASRRSHEFLTTDAVTSAVDVVVYLVRQVRRADVRYLEDLARLRGDGSVASTIAVVARADEVGAGRIDALVSAERLARRHRENPDVTRLCGVALPVAGLLAETAQTLQPERGRRPARARGAGPRGRRGACCCRWTASGARRCPCRCPPTRAPTCWTASGCSASAPAWRSCAATSWTRPELTAELSRRSGVEELRRVARRRRRGPRPAARARRARSDARPRAGRPGARGGARGTPTALRDASAALGVARPVSAGAAAP